MERVVDALREIRDALREISRDIEPRLHLVSAAARYEWRALQSSLPSDDELREGTTAMTEGELKAIEVKAGRFRDIVLSLSASAALQASEPRPRAADIAPSWRAKNGDPFVTVAPGRGGSTRKLAAT